MLNFFEFFSVILYQIQSLTCINAGGDTHHRIVMQAVRSSVDVDHRVLSTSLTIFLLNNRVVLTVHSYLLCYKLY